MSTPPRVALVIGAGIAGPVVATGLLAAGFAPTVYEAWPAGAALSAGAWLTVAVNGIEALRTFGLDEELLDVAFPSTTIGLYNGAGRLLGEVPLGGALPDGTVTQTVTRAELYRVIASQAERRGVPFVHGQRLADAQVRTDGRVVARFDDGTEAVGDVLIGADGVHSVTRRIIDPRAPSPRRTGMGNVGGIAPGAGPLADAPPGAFRMIFGRRAFFGYVAHPCGDVWWFANPPVPYPDGADAAWLASLFADDHGPAAALIAATPGPLALLDQHELPRVPRWCRGPMGIAGDAAHAASPTSGQGASLAAEDGVALARCLRDGRDDVPAALAAFEAGRRARVERIVAEAARMSSHKVPGPVGRWVRDLVLPWVVGWSARAPREWLFAHREPW